jgi:hypothetical protein
MLCLHGAAAYGSCPAAFLIIAWTPCCNGNIAALRTPAVQAAVVAAATSCCQAYTGCSIILRAAAAGRCVSYNAGVFAAHLHAVLQAKHPPLLCVSDVCAQLHAHGCCVGPQELGHGAVVGVPATQRSRHTKKLCVHHAYDTVSYGCTYDHVTTAAAAAAAAGTGCADVGRPAGTVAAKVAVLTGSSPGLTTLPQAV